MSGHTPGPWEAYGNRVRLTDHARVADTWSSAIPHDERAANARLIAAAPELLAEMKRYLPILEQCEQGTRWAKYTEGTGIATLNGYRAAIAKAEGK